MPLACHYWHLTCYSMLSTNPNAMLGYIYTELRTISSLIIEQNTYFKVQFNALHYITIRYFFIAEHTLTLSAVALLKVVD